MNETSTESPKCKTSERIAIGDSDYCCLDFRDADTVLGLFGYSAPRYFIRGPHDRDRVSIDYCPWCTKQIPWKEKI